MSDLLPVSKEEKIRSLKREIEMRERNYPKWVESKKMRADQAENEIRIMKAILHDYEPVTI